jgi:hypothetical protein
MPTAKVRASTILGEFEEAQAELIGRAVILTDGKAGTVERVGLDEMHGPRISIRGHHGKCCRVRTPPSPPSPPSSLDGKIVEQAKQLQKRAGGLRDRSIFLSSRAIFSKLISDDALNANPLF